MNAKTALTNPDHTRKYISARSTPFSPMSDGAKLLDSFGGNTTTRRIEFSFDLKTSATGSASLVMLPNCSFLSAFAGSSSASDGALSNATLNGVSSTYATNISATELDNVVRQHRIVGWGAKITWTQNSQSVMGTYQVATFAPSVMSADVIDGLSVGNTDVRLDNIYESYGIPYSGTANNAVISHSALSAMSWYSGTKSIVKGKDVYLASQPLDSRYSSFRQSNERQLGSSSEDTGAALSTTAAKDQSYTSTEGWEGFVLVLDGAASAVTTVARVTLVYHIEGIPKASLSAIRDASIQPSVISLRDLNYANDVLATKPRMYYEADADKEDNDVMITNNRFMTGAFKPKKQKKKKNPNKGIVSTGLDKFEHTLFGTTGDMLRKALTGKDGKMIKGAAEIVAGLLFA